MDDLAVRPARDDEFEAIAVLRWQWALEEEREPAGGREEFIRFFAAWSRGHADSHQCTVAARGEQLVGMAFLAVLPRVPNPRAFDRASGDVQCVYVLPAERNRGIGALMIDHMMGKARERGLERVTVHSSSGAVSAYARGGFAVSPVFLQADLA
jgi:GNAT superfamily N-acetyltransferase